MTRRTQQDRLARAWIANAEPWTRAVREGNIESRRAGTDAAILDAISRRAPRRVLDVGCGEGWLVRALAGHGIAAVGIDASGPLIEAARGADREGDYRILSYDALAAGRHDLASAGFDLAVFNYALFDEAAGALLAATKTMLTPGGAVVIQTLHPWTAAGDGAYRDGWREENFAGFGAEGWQPMPWYFRTLGAWIALIRGAGLTIEFVREPSADAGGPPLSLLIEAGC